MKFICKTLNNIQTNLITHGDPFNCDGNDIIICFTGNPGFIDFYLEFSEELHKNTGLPVCVVGHAGHEELHNEKFNKLKGQEHLFNLEGQLLHKLDLLNNHIDSRSNFHLIGHSIGAWLVLELLIRNNHLFKKTSSVNLLFPTIQRMAESKNGKWLNSFVRKIHAFVLLLIALIYSLPEFACFFLINVYLKLNALPAMYCSIILKYLNPKIWEKVLFLAYDEMDTVINLNSEAMKKIKHFTNVIYTVNDGWVPSGGMEDLIIYEPNLQMKEVNARHAFVLESSQSIALMASDFIKTKIYDK